MTRITKHCWWCDGSAEIQKGEELVGGRWRQVWVIVRSGGNKTILTSPTCAEAIAKFEKSHRWCRTFARRRSLSS